MLCVETLAFAGLPDTAVTVRLDDTYRSKGIDGTALLSRARPVVTINSDLDPTSAVLTTLHEAAHVLSGDLGHGHLFREQWRHLTTSRFLDALKVHLDRE